MWPHPIITTKNGVLHVSKGNDIIYKNIVIQNNKQHNEK